MSVSSVPNWLRIILLFLSFASFLPQIRLLWQRRDSSGISLYYVLFNLISATEQFTISFFFVVNSVEPADAFVKNPPNAGDWLNFGQFALVWVLWFIVFATCLTYTSDNDRPGQRYKVIAIYVSYLLISIIPLLVDTLNFGGRNDPYRKWAGAFFSGVHTMFISPIVTILCVTAFFAQARETGLRPDPGALSVTGLAIQAIVFVFVAVAWLGRLAFPWDKLEGYGMISYLAMWYQLVGWVAIDTAIFAVVQAVLFWLASRRGRGERVAVVGAETEPLLRG
ncbi:hypothetical protein BKA64DRAFT_268214 [Cadophora sp. MPI-SDFR-AT-0126]|nr:hypothetical protein BKA64DRAFT_268214 [Leotiomycetes sp. MPI-SDFR-AT-0126]